MTSAFIKSIEELKTDEVLSGLKLIGKIQPDQKLFLNPTVSLGSDSYLSAIIRSFTQDNNRNCTFGFLSAIIDKSFDILADFHKEKDDVYSKDQKKNLIEDLIKCRDGIYKLSMTYGYDIKMVCDLELLVQKINSKLLLFGVDTNNLPQGDMPDSLPLAKPELVRQNAVEVVKKPVKEPEPPFGAPPVADPVKTSQQIRTEKMLELRKKREMMSKK